MKRQVNSCPIFPFKKSFLAFFFFFFGGVEGWGCKPRPFISPLNLHFSGCLHAKTPFKLSKEPARVNRDYMLSGDQSHVGHHR